MPAWITRYWEPHKDTNSLSRIIMQHWTVRCLAHLKGTNSLSQFQETTLWCLEWAHSDRIITMLNQVTKVFKPHSQVWEGNKIIKPMALKVLSQEWISNRLNHSWEDNRISPQWVLSQISLQWMPLCLLKPCIQEWIPEPQTFFQDNNSQECRTNSLCLQWSSLNKSKASWSYTNLSLNLCLSKTWWFHWGQDISPVKPLTSWAGTVESNLFWTKWPSMNWRPDSRMIHQVLTSQTHSAFKLWDSY